MIFGRPAKNSMAILDCGRKRLLASQGIGSGQHRQIGTKRQCAHEFIGLFQAAADKTALVKKDYQSIGTLGGRYRI